MFFPELASLQSTYFTASCKLAKKKQTTLNVASFMKMLFFIPPPILWTLEPTCFSFTFPDATLISVTDGLKQLLDRVRRPAPAGGPTQTSYSLAYSLADHGPGAM